jgi:RING finger/CHY zinc finger protein 1
MEMLRDINCPSCGMACEKMSKREIRRIDRKIERTKNSLPVEVKEKRVSALCNECLHKTLDAPFHFYGIKCGECNSYNTKMI